MAQRLGNVAIGLCKLKDQFVTKTLAKVFGGKPTQSAKAVQIDCLQLSNQMMRQVSIVKAKIVQPFGQVVLDDRLAVRARASAHPRGLGASATWARIRCA